LIGFLINGFFWEENEQKFIGGIACVSVLASFIISVLAFIELHHSATKSPCHYLFTWIQRRDIEHSL